MMILLATVLLYVTSVTAALYGTRPIANTVLSAGRMSSITWINDNQRPSLREMGPMKVDLYVGGDTYVATLAENVDPTSRSQKVWISPTWGPNGSDYHLRFICEDPPLTIYTAEFTITAMDDTLPYHGAEKAVAQSTSMTTMKTTSPTVSVATFSMGHLNASTVSSGVTSTASTSTTASSRVSSASTQTTNPHMDKAKSGAAGGSLWKRTSVDLERIKFRMVFILWPMLIGMTLAL